MTDRTPVMIIGDQPMYEGESAVFEECVDQDCPAHRVGFKHAHLDRIEPDPGGVLA